jgi:imidazolonepropionase-like amidohydrolase
MPGTQDKPWAAQTATPSVTLTNISIIDVQLGKVHPMSWLSVVDGKINAISLGGHLPAPTGQNSVDLGGKFVLPGLIDCHVHLTATPGEATLKDLYNAAPNTVAFRSAYVAKTMLLRGFTTVRDTGGADAALRDAIAEGLVPGPRLFIAGKALSQTGGHGDFRATHQREEHKCCGGHTPGIARICNGVPECLEAARDELRQGADFLKIMCGGGVATQTDPLEMLQFTAQEIQAVTTTAKYLDTYVTAHAYTVAAIRHAVDNGVQGIEHGNFVDPETARYCKEKGVVFTPTLVVYHGYTEPQFKNFLSVTSAKKNREVLAGGLEALKILKEAGVTMCYGSDLLGGLHPLQNKEFKIRSAVLDSSDIIQSATVNGAKYLGMEGKIGVLKEDSIADILVLTENPLEDIGVLDRVGSTLLVVFKEGRVVASKLSGLAVDELYQYNLR